MHHSRYFVYRTALYFVFCVLFCHSRVFGVYPVTTDNLFRDQCNVRTTTTAAATATCGNDVFTV